MTVHLAVHYSILNLQSKPFGVLAVGNVKISVMIIMQLKKPHLQQGNQTASTSYNH